MANVALKRVLVGRAFASHRLEHTLLPKILALPVFASDALSSVAYATGEILVALSLVTADPDPYVIPISLAIAALMTIVIVSYRQTVRAYPNGGGAYIVSKENLGAVPGLIAAAALMFDYMMTVVVSIVAGVFAIGSAYPLANEHKVFLAILFVAFITMMNLRGAKESGRLFAIPTYGFIVAIMAMIGVGLVDCLGGCPTVGLQVEPLHNAATAAGAVGLFAILKAFSLGATALTGVEAISNGVPAFRRPQAKNAAATLAVMGAIAITMFLGISWLTTHVGGVVASEERSVVAQVAIAIFGNSSVGFYIVQAFTALILILAANTAYQDFPRLASLLARDRYAPSQFINRGDRLVFSNGVLVLGLLSCLMIYAFDAELGVLINFYVVGVFTSFTLSQTGMVRHWLAEGRKGSSASPGWRRSIAINAIGALTTFVVLIVVIISKAPDGAWLSILIMAALVPVFVVIHRHYRAVTAQLAGAGPGAVGITSERVLLVVHDLDAATAEALGYVRAMRRSEVIALHPIVNGAAPDDTQERWRTFAGDSIPLEVHHGKRLVQVVRERLRSLDRRTNDLTTIVIPELVRGRLVTHLLHRWDLFLLKLRLLREPGVAITDVPVHVIDSQTPAVDGRVLIPQRVVTLAFVSSVNAASVRAVRYAMSLEAAETRAIHFQLDAEDTQGIERRWFDANLPIPLDIVEAPFRDLTAPILEEVRRFTTRPDTVVNVVIPELIVRRPWHLFLHNQTALFVKRLLLFEERAILTSVPFPLHGRRHDPEPGRSSTERADRTLSPRS
ncbi:MAG TPA: APC family permease [Actinomycetota bacterium]|nr:APC family permease [Actinomycetota bacterium]